MSEQVKPYYDILGVEKSATTREIRNAYRKLAAKYHPDVCKEEGAEERFERIVEAYEVLSNEETRKEYDEFLKAYQSDKHLDFDTLFNQFHSKHKSLYAPIKGGDLEMYVYFTATEARNEAEKIISFDRYENCNYCEGHGFKRRAKDQCESCGGMGYTLVDKSNPFGDIKVEHTCPSCEGKGYLNIEDCESCAGKGKKSVLAKVKVKMLPQTIDGFRLKLKGMGDAGLNGGKYGDLILIFKQDKEDPFIIKDTYDIDIEKEISYVTSIVGGTTKVLLPRGETIKVPVPHGVKSGHQVIVPGEGLYDPTRKNYGNLNVIIRVNNPSISELSKVFKMPEEKVRGMFSSIK